MKRLLFTTMIIVICANSVSAQETVYFKKESGDSNKKKKKNFGESNIIKVDPLSFIAGVVPVYYERQVNDFLGIQIGAGITTRNYLKDIFSSSDIFDTDVKSNTYSDGTTDSYDNENSPTDYKNRTAKTGYFFSVSPRIYFDDEALDGSYIGITYSNTRYNSESKKIAVGAGSGVTGEPSFTGGSFSEVEKYSDVMATFGTQTLYDHISLDYSFGIGLRRVSGYKYAYAIDYNGDYIDGVSNIDKTKLAFNFGIRVGYHF